MIIVLKQGTEKSAVDKFVEDVKEKGFGVHLSTEQNAHRTLG